MIIIPGYSKNFIQSCMPKCNPIVHHKQHAYDEHGKVIIVPIADEDRQELIQSYANETGLKNVLARLVKSGDTLGYRSMAYNDETESGDETGIPTKVNEIVEAGSTADARINEALKNFNEKTGLNLTVDEFIKASSEGKLLDLIADAGKSKEEVKEGE